MTNTMMKLSLAGVALTFLAACDSEGGYYGQHDLIGGIHKDGASVQQLIVMLVTSTPFLSRATEEL